MSVVNVTEGDEPDIKVQTSSIKVLNTRGNMKFQDQEKDKMKN